MFAFKRKTVVPTIDAPLVELEPDAVRVVLDGETLAHSQAAYKVYGAALSPLYFLPAQHVDTSRLHPSDSRGQSDWGGRIAYFHLIGPDGLIPNAVWFFPEADGDFAALRNHLAFFPQAVDEAWVGDARALPFSGASDGGWTLRGPAEAPAHDICHRPIA